MAETTVEAPPRHLLDLPPELLERIAALCGRRQGRYDPLPQDALSRTCWKLREASLRSLLENINDQHLATPVAPELIDKLGPYITDVDIRDYERGVQRDALLLLPRLPNLVSLRLEYEPLMSEDDDSVGQSDEVEEVDEWDESDDVQEYLPDEAEEPAPSFEALRAVLPKLKTLRFGQYWSAHGIARVVELATNVDKVAFSDLQYVFPPVERDPGGRPSPSRGLDDDSFYRDRAYHLDDAGAVVEALAALPLLRTLQLAAGTEPLLHAVLKAKRPPPKLYRLDLTCWRFTEEIAAFVDLFSSTLEDLRLGTLGELDDPPPLFRSTFPALRTFSTWDCNTSLERTVFSLLPNLVSLTIRAQRGCFIHRPLDHLSIVRPLAHLNLFTLKDNWGPEDDLDPLLNSEEAATLRAHCETHGIHLETNLAPTPWNDLRPKVDRLGRAIKFASQLRSRAREKRDPALVRRLEELLGPVLEAMEIDEEGLTDSEDGEEDEDDSEASSNNF
ncbi:hypothetical protein JCM10207_008388 [Rhodosporidiobolus poonsookiae]